MVDSSVLAQSTASSRGPCRPRGAEDVSCHAQRFIRPALFAGSMSGEGAPVLANGCIPARTLRWVRPLRRGCAKSGESGGGEAVNICRRRRRFRGQG